MAEPSEIKVQSFTRVHMVPRVNQGKTIALAFELPGASTVAYGAPVQTLEQIFAMIPKVLADAKKLRSETGLLDAIDSNVIANSPWEVHSFESALTPEGALSLSVQMSGCHAHLLLKHDQIKHLRQLLDIYLVPNPTVHKVNTLTSADDTKRITDSASKTIKKTASPKAEAKKSVVKKSAAMSPVKSEPAKKIAVKPATKTISKAKPAKK